MIINETVWSGFLCDFNMDMKWIWPYRWLTVTSVTKKCQDCIAVVSYHCERFYQLLTSGPFIGMFGIWFIQHYAVRLTICCWIMLSIDGVVWLLDYYCVWAKGKGHSAVADRGAYREGYIESIWAVTLLYHNLKIWLGFWIRVTCSVISVNEIF